MTKAFYITCDDKTTDGQEVTVEEILASLYEASGIVGLTVRETTP